MNIPKDFIIREEFLPFALPFYDETEIGEVVDSINSNWWTKGPKTAKFEEEFAKFVGAKYALAVNSCTAALHLALISHEIPKGSEVITTVMTFAASVNTIIHAGLTPVLADIDPSTGLIDPKDIIKKITPKTRAIMPVHFAGAACDMDEIRAIANKYNLVIIEDAAHATGTTYKGEHVGASGTACFSFYANKNLACGEGGMLVSDDKKMMEAARVQSLHGMSKNAWNRFAGGSWRYDVEYAGFKYNLTDIAAGLGLVQLERFDKMQDNREKIVKIYDEEFLKNEFVTPLKRVDYGVHANHLYIIKIDSSKLKINRDEIIETLTNHYKIGLSVHYTPIHLHSYYQKTFGFKAGDFKQAEALYEGCISLPIYPGLTQEDALYVARAVSSLTKANAR